MTVSQCIDRIGQRVLSGDCATTYRAEDRKGIWHSIVAIDNKLPSRLVDSGVVEVFVVADIEN
ncbi:hypothetical protein [Streptomyces sp. NPDC017448]|uniref:hypothetical protein n=1 Tax=Streptomyces sp. NPDC017448 TaxID=3364996 RepID=UPI003790520A